VVVVLGRRRPHARTGGLVCRSARVVINRAEDPGEAPAELAGRVAGWTSLGVGTPVVGKQNSVANSCKIPAKLPLTPLEVGEPQKIDRPRAHRVGGRVCHACSPAQAVPPSGACDGSSNASLTRSSVLMSAPTSHARSKRSSPAKARPVLIVCSSSSRSSGSKERSIRSHRAYAPAASCTAGLLGISASTVRRLSERGLEALRKTLTEEGFAPSNRASEPGDCSEVTQAALTIVTMNRRRQKGHHAIEPSVHDI
jgi:hypothetical protein